MRGRGCTSFPRPDVARPLAPRCVGDARSVDGELTVVAVRELEAAVVFVGRAAGSIREALALRPRVATVCGALVPRVPSAGAVVRPRYAVHRRRGTGTRSGAHSTSPPRRSRPGRRLPDRGTPCRPCALRSESSPSRRVRSHRRRSTAPSRRAGGSRTSSPARNRARPVQGRGAAAQQASART